MESIFPVFSQLHTDDPPVAAVPAEAIPCERTGRKAFANDAGLFVVTGQKTEEPSDEATDEIAARSLKVTGDVPHDLAAALYCLAFLSEFFAAIEPGDLGKLAEELRHGDD
jgi:hypothetical protein